MSKDTIKVNMNVYDIPIVVEQLKKLEQENKQLKEKIDKAIEYINTTDKWLCRVNDNLCVETIGKDKLLEILGDKENEI